MLFRLHSDFIDYYDHHFAGSFHRDAQRFDRMSVNSMDRKAMFAKLQAMGLSTPDHGTVNDLYQRQVQSWREQGFAAADLDGMLSIVDLVVYTDPFAHAGEGKIKISVAQALQDHPDLYASVFVPQNPSNTGISLRHLRIGSRQFWLRYTSDNDWRSNAGDVNIEYLCEEAPKPLEYALQSPEPLLAIDFITGQDRRLIAVDYNTAPKIKGTGVDAVLAPKLVVDEISAWLRHASAST